MPNQPPDIIYEQLKRLKLPYRASFVVDVLLHMSQTETALGELSIRDLAMHFVDAYAEFLGPLADLVFLKANVTSWNDVAQVYKFLESINFIELSNSDSLDELSKLDLNKPFIAYIKDKTTTYKND